MESSEEVSNVIVTVRFVGLSYTRPTRALSNRRLPARRTPWTWRARGECRRGCVASLSS